jgi:hypothetical protein
MRELNESLVMTTCKCRENNNNLVMTRAWFEEMLSNKIAEGASKEQDRIIKLLEEDCGCHDLYTCIAHSFIALIKGENK